MTRVTIVLPKPMSGYDGCLEHAQERIADTCGGFTMYDATGGWVEDGCVVEEDVTVIEGYCDKSHANAVIWLDGIVEYIMGWNLYNESAIMFTVGNDQYLVNSSDGDRLRITA
jgi:hypothetical protein